MIAQPPSLAMGELRSEMLSCRTGRAWSRLADGNYAQWVWLRAPVPFSVAT